MKLKEFIARKGDEAARMSYGKSVPFLVYEPKIPQALKRAADEGDKAAKSM